MLQSSVGKECITLSLACQEPHWAFLVICDLVYRVGQVVFVCFFLEARSAALWHSMSSKKMQLAGFMCFRGGMCWPSPFLAASCHMMEESFWDLHPVWSWEWKKYIWNYFLTTNKICLDWKWWGLFCSVDCQAFQLNTWSLCALCKPQTTLDFFSPTWNYSCSYLSSTKEIAFNSLCLQ